MAEMSLKEQAISVLATFKASLKNGKVLASQEEVERRASLCLGCEKLKSKKGKYACVVCGCSYRRKIAFSGSNCPIGKW